ncbi:hypothetical protein CHS0354_019801 [Potamilus streckersoni]|uniref:Uncharacterized protein n=1 Tax=Potamilus streckersoni TaxID=2493646 RepID=A0AAE0SUX0_9BIVA|nr:hypothetical protein CHS0354_019801 [Potamilus streckersoni]
MASSSDHELASDFVEAELTGNAVSGVNRSMFSLKWRFSGRAHSNKEIPWLLDVVLNPDHDLIVTDGKNNELKKFSLQGTLKDKLTFKTRPDCLALTDGYLVTVTFPFETILHVVDTKGKLSVVSTIPFRLQCAGITSMKDGRLVICNRESRSVFLCSKGGQILQEIKNGSSGETLFRNPSYVRAVDNRTICVSDFKTQEFFIIVITDDNKFIIKQCKLTEPRTSCVVDGMLLVAASNIRVFTLDGKKAGEITLDGVHHARGLTFSEDERLLAVTHKSDADEEISVYQILKH